MRLSEFHGPNAGYVLELYQRYLRDPQAVDAASRSAFEQWQPEPDSGSVEPAVAGGEIVGAAGLAQAIREYGHLAARLDPLGTPPPGDPSLDLGTYGLGEASLRRLPAGLIAGPLAETRANAWEVIEALRSVYTSHTGYDYDHLRVPEERNWLRQVAETGRFRPPADPIDPLGLLQRLTQVEVFETFLQRIFPGMTRFSIQGVDMLVPMLDELLGAAAETGVCTLFLGMAHRGRLNVLAHVLQKPYAQIMSEFKGSTQGHAFRHDLGWTGDVKYHKGARRALKGGQEISLFVMMAPNASHVESIDPVLEGMARAAQDVSDRPGPYQRFPRACMPILVHGDAAFSAQGVVAETLNLSRLAGYTTGGTVHIIANNQLGYTTEPAAGRSTLYASDLAKGFKIPIVHVNADDPEACIEAARLAFAYRDRFHKDFVIDLIGYRRYGHNEGDEPRFTQPVMYRQVDEHPGVRQLWAQRLLKDDLVDREAVTALVDRQMARLQEVFETLEPEEELLEPQLEPPEPGLARRVETGVTVERLRALNEALMSLPDGFQPNSKLARTMKRRRDLPDDPSEPAIDWAAAESLALASILEDGVAVRMTGQDVERGTFSQRHAVLHDDASGETFIPLQALPQAHAGFEIFNSPLSENAALGFEYGYNALGPDRLVVWEAQYGDFVNNAQTVIDEYVAAGRAKWEQTPSLVMLLPHGYEGQGPDHSSAYLERFLQLAADTNLRIANPTGAGQFFHLLRRQALLLKSDPLPLVVFTPKSLLRHPAVSSSLRALAQERWQPVLDDETARARADQIRCLQLCSGKVYVDLAGSELRERSPGVAIARLEQLYPFPAAELGELLGGYPDLEQLLWVQEEPENMGAWSFVQPRLAQVIAGRWPLRYVGRPRSASPAEGASSWHKVNQDALVELAYNLQKAEEETETYWLETA